MCRQPSSDGHERCHYPSQAALKPSFVASACRGLRIAVVAQLVAKSHQLAAVVNEMLA